MTRADRRARTETVRNRRRRLRDAVQAPVCDRARRADGMLRSKSPFDCGRPQCGVCKPNRKAVAKERRKEVWVRTGTGHRAKIV